MKGILVSLKKRPSLIIVDIDVADICYSNLILILKTAAETKNIPIVLKSHKLTKVDQVRLLKLGVDEFLFPNDLHYSRILNIIKTTLTKSLALMQEEMSASIEPEVEEEEEEFVFDELEADKQESKPEELKKEEPKQETIKDEEFSSFFKMKSKKSKPQKEKLSETLDIDLPDFTDDSEVFLEPLLASGSLESRIDQFIKESSFPASMNVLINNVSEIDVDTKKLINTLKTDEITAKNILEMANSKLHNSSEKRISLIEEAVEIIGNTGLLNILLQACLLQQVEDLEGFDKNTKADLINNVLMCAVIADKIAELTGYKKPNLCFILGILQSFGSLLLMKRFPEEYKKLLEIHGVSKIQINLLEDNLLGINNIDITCQILSSWNLSENIILPIKSYNNNYTELIRSNKEANKLAIILKLARQIAVSSSSDMFYDDNIEEIPVKALEQINLPVSKITDEFSDTINLLKSELQKMLPDLTLEYEPENKSQEIINMLKGKKIAVINFNKSYCSLLEIIFKNYNINTVNYNSFSKKTISFQPDVVLFNLTVNQSIDHLVGQIKAYRLSKKMVFPAIFLVPRDFLVKYNNVNIDNCSFIGKPYTFSTVFRELENIS